METRRKAIYRRRPSTSCSCRVCVCDTNDGRECGARALATLLQASIPTAAQYPIGTTYKLVCRDIYDEVCMSIAYCISKRLSQNEKIAYIVFICYFYFSSSSSCCLPLWLCLSLNAPWTRGRFPFINLYVLYSALHAHTWSKRANWCRVECLNVDFVVFFFSFSFSSRAFKNTSHWKVCCTF